MSDSQTLLIQMGGLVLLIALVATSAFSLFAAAPQYFMRTAGTARKHPVLVGLLVVLALLPVGILIATIRAES